MNHSRYQFAGPHISSESFDDEFVVLNLENGQYFSLAGGAAIIWRAVQAGHAPADLLSALPPNSEAAQAFQACFEKMLDSGLLIPDPLPAQRLEPVFTESLLQIETDYRLEAFDDLAALLMADPIHEVEPEAGWPHRAA